MWQLRQRSGQKGCKLAPIREPTDEESDLQNGSWALTEITEICIEFGASMTKYICIFKQLHSWYVITHTYPCFKGNLVMLPFEVMAWANNVSHTKQ